MTVILPGMIEDDQRVKINSVESNQQGLLDSYKTKVNNFLFFFKNFLKGFRRIYHVL